MSDKKKLTIKKLFKYWPLCIVIFCFWLLLGVKVPLPTNQPSPNGAIGNGGKTKEISLLRYLVAPPKSQASQKKPTEQSSGLKALSVLKISHNEFTPVLETWGEVQSPSGAALELVSEVSAKVIELADIHPGSTVTKGQVLVHLDNTDTTYALEQAQAKLDELEASLDSAQTLLPLEQQVLEVAEKSYARYQDLAKQNVTSTANVEEQLRTFLQAQQSVQTQKNSIASLEAQIASQQSVVREAQNNLDKTQIKAPVNGRILEINIQVGQYLNANTAVLRMVNINEQEVQSLISFSKLVAFLPDTTVIDNLIGLKGYFTLEENGYERNWPITISAIPAELSAESRDIKVRFSFDDPASAPLLGTYGQVTLLSPENRDIIIVPRDSIRQGKAYILDDTNAIHATPVKTSIIGDKWLWVQQGLNINEQLVIQPPIPFVENIIYEPKDDARVTDLLNEFIVSTQQDLQDKGAK
ncbi:MAG: efflux RND transporter periplasmic adaptor subunit [Alphaproteobacteria bacterium]